MKYANSVILTITEDNTNDSAPYRIKNGITVLTVDEELVNYEAPSTPHRDYISILNFVISYLSENDVTYSVQGDGVYMFFPTIIFINTTKNKIARMKIHPEMLGDNFYV